MFQFGIGGLWCNPTAGNLATNPTPYEMLTVMDVSVDINQEIKDLTGQFKFPDDVATGAGKVAGKFSVGRIDMASFNQLMFASPQTVGTIQMTPAPGEAVTVVSGTATVKNATTFDEDLGVRSASNMVAYQRVTGTPLPGEYAVAAGVYTFATADPQKNFYVSYTWNDAIDGYTVLLNQQLMGYGPIFELWLSEPYQMVNGKANGLHLFSCRLSKLGQEFKNNDYMKPSFEYTAFANPAGDVAEFFQVAP
jgi:hypothetical protein